MLPPLTPNNDIFMSSKWPPSFAPSLQSIQEHSHTKYKKIRSQSIHKSTMKLSQSQTASYPQHPHIEPISINLYNTQTIPSNPKKRRRASQPLPYETMMYEPIPIDSPLLPPNTALTHPYLTKRQLNELRMKHYNTTHDYNKHNRQKHRRFSCDLPRKTPIYKQPIPIDRIYDYIPPTTTFHTKRTEKQSIKTTMTQYSISNGTNIHKNIYNNPYIDQSVTSSLTSIKTPTYSPQIKKKKTKISRRKSKSKQQIINDQYEHKIQIKTPKKNKIERCKSYDNSYKQCNDEDIDHEDPEINHNKTAEIHESNASTLTPEYNIDNTLSRKTLKKKRKQCNSTKRKKKKKKKKKNTQQMDEIKKKTNSKKKILRVREGKLGERVVTFSRRNSVFGSGGKSTTRTDTDDEERLMKLKKSLDEDRKKLDEERVKIECLKTELNEKQSKLEKEQSEYTIRWKELELKEAECRQKQVMLLRDEIEVNDDKCKLKKIEKWMNTQTERFDTVLSDFYMYQHSVNAMCDKHIQLMDTWIQSAQHVVGNMRECVMNPVQQMVYDILRYKDLEDEDRNKFEEYERKMNEMYNLSENEICFEEINKIHNELKHMPRPNISEEQAKECEMRLQNKWRDYLSVRFGDEYKYPSKTVSDDSKEEIFSEDELVLDIKSDDETDDDSKMSQLETIDYDMDFECDDKHLNEDGNTEFIRSKHQHRRTGASFIKTPAFLDDLDPFWSMKYDSPNEIDGLIDDDGDLLDLELQLDTSRSSDSTAVVYTDDAEYGIDDL